MDGYTELIKLLVGSYYKYQRRKESFDTLNIEKELVKLSGDLHYAFNELKRLFNSDLRILGETDKLIGDDVHPFHFARDGKAGEYFQFIHKRYREEDEKLLANK